LAGRLARQGPERRVADHYYYFPSDHEIWLMSLYDKDEASDLTAREKKALKTSIGTELAARASRIAGKGGTR